MEKIPTIKTPDSPHNPHEVSTEFLRKVFSSEAFISALQTTIQSTEDHEGNEAGFHMVKNQILWILRFQKLKREPTPTCLAKKQKALILDFLWSINFRGVCI